MFKRGTREAGKVFITNAIPLFHSFRFSKIPQNNLFQFVHFQEGACPLNFRNVLSQSRQHCDYLSLFAILLVFVVSMCVPGRLLLRYTALSSQCNVLLSCRACRACCSCFGIHFPLYEKISKLHSISPVCSTYVQLNARSLISQRLVIEQRRLLASPSDGKDSGSSNSFEKV